MSHADRVKLAETQYRRAETRHIRAQIAGRTDGSIHQTRRMYLAVCALQRAAFRLRDAQQNLKWSTERSRS